MMAEVIEKIIEAIAADVIGELRKDDRYSAVVTGLAQQAVAQVTGRSDVVTAPVVPA